MSLGVRDVSPLVAARQSARYRAMTPDQKLACADALWVLAWDAVQEGVRLRRPDLSPIEVEREARVLFRRAAD